MLSSTSSPTNSLHLCPQHLDSVMVSGSSTDNNSQSERMPSDGFLSTSLWMLLASIGPVAGSPGAKISSSAAIGLASNEGSCETATSTTLLLLLLLLLLLI